MSDQQKPPAAESGQAIEQWAQDKQTESWWLAGAKSRRKWGEGRVVSEAEFDAAINEVKGIRLADPVDSDTAKKEAAAKIEAAKKAADDEAAKKLPQPSLEVTDGRNS